jgi:monofunctional biosynthetic peptidoglycan transglycosylase
MYWRVIIFGVLLMTLSGLAANAGEERDGEEQAITDFTSNTPDMGWFVVNDNVMGGRSDGDFSIEGEQLHFAGRTNTRGGGFSSIRTRPMLADLSQHDGIRLHVKGDGRRYTWRLSTTARWRGREISYWADFDTLDGEWSVVDIPFSRFVPRFRGTRLDGPELDTTQITGMGLMIYDKQDGPFALRMSSVHAYSARAAFSLAQFRWNNRVLVVSAPDRNDEDFKQQLQAVKASAEEFTDRDMVLVTLLDDSGSTAGDRELTKQETAATREALRIEPDSFAVRLIGKDGSVKLSKDTATAMAEIYALIDTMPMRKQETTDRL